MRSNRWREISGGKLSAKCYKALSVKAVKVEMANQLGQVILAPLTVLDSGQRFPGGEPKELDKIVPVVVRRYVGANFINLHEGRYLVFVRSEAAKQPIGNGFQLKSQFFSEFPLQGFLIAFTTFYMTSHAHVEAAGEYPLVRRPPRDPEFTV